MKIWNRLFTSVSKEQVSNPVSDNHRPQKASVQKLKNPSRITPEPRSGSRLWFGLFTMIIKPASKDADTKSTRLSVSVLEGKLLKEVHSFVVSQRGQVCDTIYLTQLVGQYISLLGEGKKSMGTCLQLLALRESILKDLSATGHSHEQSSLQDITNQLGQKAFTFIPPTILGEHAELVTQIFSDNPLTQTEAFFKLHNLIGSNSGNFSNLQQQTLFQKACHSLAFPKIQAQQEKAFSVTVTPESEQQCRESKRHLYQDGWQEISKVWEEQNKLVAPDLSRKDFARSDATFSHNGEKLFDFEQVKAQGQPAEAQSSTAIHEALIEEEVVQALHKEELSVDQQMQVMNRINQTEHNIMMESLQREVIERWPDLGILLGADMQNTIDVDIQGDEIVMTFSIEATPQLVMHTGELIQYNKPSVLKMERTISIRKGVFPEYWPISVNLTLGAGHKIS